MFDRELYSYANFSIVMPGGCNAACSFCSWEDWAGKKTIKLKDKPKNIKAEHVKVGNCQTIRGGC